MGVALEIPIEGVIIEKKLLHGIFHDVAKNNIVEKTNVYYVPGPTTPTQALMCKETDSIHTYYITSPWITVDHKPDTRSLHPKNPNPKMYFLNPI